MSGALLPQPQAVTVARRSSGSGIATFGGDPGLSGAQPTGGNSRIAHALFNPGYGRPLTLV
jgi:hypothetical protein